MEMTVRLPERLYKDFTEFCKQQGIAPEDKISDIVSDWLYLELYGDLNEKLNPSGNQEIHQSVVEPEEPVGKQPETTVVEKVEEVKTIQEISVAEKQTNMEKKPTVRSRRTIKAK